MTAPVWSRRRSWALPVGTVTVVIGIPLTTLFVGTWLAGWRLQPLDTGSMAPAFERGALLVVAPVTSARVDPGTVVVIDDPARSGRLIAHRVMRVSGSNGDVSYETKGDANAVDDPWTLTAASIRGEVKWGIPGLGRVLTLLRWPWNALVLVAFPALLLLASETTMRIRRRRHPTSHPCEVCPYAPLVDLAAAIPHPPTAG